MKLKNLHCCISLLFMVILIGNYAESETPDGMPVVTQAYQQLNLPKGATMRLGKGSIDDIKYSPDGELLAVASSIGIWIYDAHTGDELNFISEHKGPVQYVSFSPDGESLISASTDSTVQVWDMINCEHRRTLKEDKNYVYFTMAINPNGQLIANLSSDHENILLWHSATGELLHTLRGHTDTIESIVFCPNNKILASGSQDKTVRLWSIQTGETLNTLKGHQRFVFGVAFSPDGKILASGSADHTVRLWDIETGNTQNILMGHKGWVLDVAFSPDGKTLAAGSSDDIQIWDVATGKPIRTLIERNGACSNLAYSPDGKTLASNTNDTVILWDMLSPISTYSPMNQKQGIHATDFKKFHLPKGASIRLGNGTIYNLQYSPDGSRLAVATSIGIWLFDLKTADPLFLFTGRTPPIANPEYIPKKVHFSSDGKTLAGVSHDDTVRFWDTQSGNRLRTPIWHENNVIDVAYSQDKWIIATEWNNHYTHLWEPVPGGDPETGKLLHTLTGHKRNIDSIVFSNDGQTIAGAAHNGYLCLWDTKTDKLRYTLKPDTHDVIYLVFSSDDKIIAAGGYEGTIGLWNPMTGELLHRINPDPENSLYSTTSCVTISPDGKTLASGSYGRINLWNTKTGKHIRTITGQDERGTVIRSLEFSPDGKTLASCAGGTVLLWNLASFDE